MSEFKGKGSKHRPHDKDKFNSEFERIFGKTAKKPATEQKPTKEEKK